ncbi:divalent metal cation transporter [Streptomyces armeniacus]|uniref:Divalent metal cation transporter n=1 Tax=Streptomyces armeniacus TaxID=83291 RepID=A0A345XY21_9ACTN|nr:Nramp family divalent metal transporter [Streptomyces armeniacus]AXK36537.1 divalent metal cation transporter [Streptomyces armeniacus]
MAKDSAPDTGDGSAGGSSKGGSSAGRDSGDGGVGKDAAPVVRKPSWRRLGPGIVVAATGVGAGDLVSTLLAGSKFGYTLLWAAVIGCIVKIALAEAVGRWHLATGRTLFDGWRTLGPWTTVYFAIYVVIWGFVYGATAMSSSGLPLQALFPDGPGLKFWGVATGLLGLAFVWFNRYAVVEKIMMVFVGVMFVVVVYVAIRATPKVDDALAGLLPTLPDGSLLYTLGLVGGVGGTITMAAYGYWINAKGWTDSGWMRMMRFDNRIAYITTGIFVVAMLIVGAELLHAGQVALAEGDKGLVDLTEILEDRYGGFTAKLFLIGFFAASFSSLVGVWHGVSLMFADFMDRLRAGGTAGVKVLARGEQERSPAFRGYLLWLTFPPMMLLWLDQPFGLVIAYGVLGAFFMPFLAVTLMWLLNTERTPREFRSGPLSNTMLGLSGGLFVVLCVEQVRELPW